MTNNAGDPESGSDRPYFPPPAPPPPSGETGWAAPTPPQPAAQAGWGPPQPAAQAGWVSPQSPSPAWGATAQPGAWTPPPGQQWGPPPGQWGQGMPPVQQKSNKRGCVIAAAIVGALLVLGGGGCAALVWIGYNSTTDGLANATAVGVDYLDAVAAGDFEVAADLTCGDSVRSVRSNVDAVIGEDIIGFTVSDAVYQDSSFDSLAAYSNATVEFEDGTSLRIRINSEDKGTSTGFDTEYCVDGISAR